MKTYTAKDLPNDFTIALQFINKEDGTDMVLTTNIGKGLDVTSMRVHGLSLAENTKQLDDKDHEGLQAFCRSYLEGSGYYVR